MSRLNIKKLYVKKNIDSKAGFSLPRKYTLTHSDKTGDFFLTIDRDYDTKTLENWYIKLMRDEVLAEWKKVNENEYLILYCHICGGICFGWASLRNQIFHSELPLAIEAICNGDIDFINNNRSLMEAEVIVNFHATKKEYNNTENWGKVKEYILNQCNSQPDRA
jgi:hypothetical protein